MASNLLVGGSYYTLGEAVDGSGNVYFVDSYSSTVYKITKNGSTYGAPVTVDSTSLNPFGVAVDGAGNVYIGDYGNLNVVKIPWNGSSYGDPHERAPGLDDANQGTLSSTARETSTSPTTRSMWWWKCHERGLRIAHPWSYPSPVSPASTTSRSIKTAMFLCPHLWP